MKVLFRSLLSNSVNSTAQNKEKNIVWTVWKQYLLYFWIDLKVLCFFLNSQKDPKGFEKSLAHWKTFLFTIAVKKPLNKKDPWKDQVLLWKVETHNINLTL